MSEYHAKTMAHSIAASGTNLACNKVFLDGNWDDGYSNVDFENGSFSVGIQVLDSWKNIRKLTSTGTYGGEYKNH